MPNLEDRVEELEQMIQAILADLGGLAMKVGGIDIDLKGHKEQISNRVDNMALNALENRKRIQDLENRLNEN